MNEIFFDISDDFRMRTQLAIKLALCQQHAGKAAEIMAEYAKNCLTAEEKKYVDFAFSVEMERLKNER